MGNYPRQTLEDGLFSPLGSTVDLPPPDFLRKNVTQNLFTLEVGVIPTKSKKLGVSRTHPTCAEVSVPNLSWVFTGKY